MKFIFTLLIPFFCLASFAQKTSSELYLDLKKMASLKRVLYLAAHPDDENTRALAWLSLGEEAQTAYLSLTRGDGGQNLIGEELGADLGILRSQELLAARNIDNAQQFFSRAVDFGYSKSAEETFKKWEEEEVLSDVVRVIRQFKPDVIITRFPPDERAGHGHHTASAMLAITALEKANDPNFAKDQVNQFGTWSPNSVYWNSSVWWNKEIEKEATDNPDYLVYDIGAYNELLGQSYNEIGTLARSQHKCQGFGSLIERGERLEYFQYLAGEKLKDNLFEKSQRTWTNVVSEKLEKDFQNIVSNYDFVNPSNNVQALLTIYAQLANIKDNFLRQEKLELCQALIIESLGLNIELLAEDFSFAINEEIPFTLSIINRSKMDVSIEQVTVNDTKFSITNAQLTPNKVVDNELKIKASGKYYNPYWLQSPYENLFNVLNVEQVGNPSTTPSVSGVVKLKIGSQLIAYNLKGEHKWGDPSYGERRREVVFTPNFAVSIGENTFLAKSNTSKTLKVKVHNFSESINEKITINVPQGWTATPAELVLKSNTKHEEQFFEIILSPTSAAKSGNLTLKNSQGKAVQNFHEIKYDHIPSQVYFSDASVNVVNLNAEIVKGKIGYIKGVEEKVPQAIEQLGFDLTMIEVEELSTVDLAQFQTVLVGIRAYNVKPELINFKEKMMDYVAGGGNLIVQYNTSTSSIREMQIGPFPFDISRDRVTEEDAPPTFLLPDHELLNKPNKITEADFNNWVQERGLYFASNWDEKYQTIISWSDEGQEPLEGGLIVANHGKGHFIYTGISFFRELPQGVEGAYRLFANLLSYGRN